MFVANTIYNNFTLIQQIFLLLVNTSDTHCPMHILSGTQEFAAQG